MHLDSLEFIHAKNFGPSLPAFGQAGSRDVGLIIVHTMESPERKGTARNVALWFAGPTAPQASAHFCVDDVDVIQCVRLEDVAWAAPGANRDGVHIEHAGCAGQSAEQWDDDYSRSVLFNSAKLAAELCARFGIPPVKVDPKPGARGFCGHVDVTNWRNGGNGHQDPGPNFPWNQYLALVEQFIAGRPTDAPPAPDPIANRETIPDPS